jgi:hypothetical protein
MVVKSSLPDSVADAMCAQGFDPANHRREIVFLSEHKQPVEVVGHKYIRESFTQPTLLCFHQGLYQAAGIQQILEPGGSIVCGSGDQIDSACFRVATLAKIAGV